ncbi:MAG TPA: GNAT family N-acetyltransferase [Galbitalea sp.]|nr:GNAT family N-acetyltransferase [Galbitalea sp.]
MNATVRGWQVRLVAIAEVRMLLRDVEPADVDAYVRMRCDPAMMAELGGPLPRNGIEAKLDTDVRKTRADDYWVSMIVPDLAAPDIVAGTVGLWSHEDGDDAGLTEIGWMVLPEFQGQGYAKRAVRAVLERARDDGRWGVVHAYPGVSKAASNALCRSVGFTFGGERTVPFAGRELHTNHWLIDPGTDLA